MILGSVKMNESRPKIESFVPKIEEIISRGIPINLAKRGESWSERQLGEYAKKIGIYVIQHDNKIKYVGKTDEKTMSFGMRLRREFQQSASQNRHLFPKLLRLKIPPEIKVTFFDSEEISNYINIFGLNLSEKGKIRIFEQILTQLYEPDFQIKHS